MLLLFTFNLLSELENLAQDRLYNEPGIVDPNIVVFGIDEETLIELGPVQYWSRQRMADAISILNSYPDEKPAVIAIDVLYSGQSNDPAADDALVAAATEGGNVVFGAMASFNWDGEVKTFEKPFEALDHVSRYGAVNAVIDDDGVVRRATPFLDVDGVMEPTFASAIYEMYTGMPVEVPHGVGDPMYLAYTGAVGDYYGAIGLGSSFKDIFADDFDPGFYAGAIIMIGPYASGLMDSYFSPVDHRIQMHGVEIHANIVQMMLDENYKTDTPVWLDFVIVLLTMIIFIAVFTRFGVGVSSACLIVFAAGYVFLNKWLFNGGFVLSLLYPPVSAAALFVFVVIFNYITERLEKQKIKDMFKKYVDPKLVDELINADMTDGKIGMKKHFAVLFVDIRGFTPMSEELKDDPETLVHILNEYLELTASCIFNNGGSVDKFIGDATMALFNGFTPLEDYTYRAVKTAIDIVNGAKTLNKSILEKYGKDVGFGVGVNCGYAVVGNIGPNFRKDYTAIGDTVNTAARLESSAKSSQVLISKDVFDMLEGRISAESLGEIALKGKAPVEVYSLTGLGGRDQGSGHDGYRDEIHLIKGRSLL